MSFARVTSIQPSFPEAHLVDVECDLSQGLHSFAVVGLPDKAVEEARDRVAAAIKYSGFTSPKAHTKKVVISLAPADLKKEGPLFDVAIALAYLLAAGDVSLETSGRAFLGELALDGSVRPIRGALSAAIKARAGGVTELYVPKENAREAALVSDIAVYPITSLKELIDHLEAPEEPLDSTEQTALLTPMEHTSVSFDASATTTDFHDIRGQENAKRGLLIAAAGRHNIVLYGPPGTGKTLLARAFSGILPPLSFPEALEATIIHSLAGSLEGDLITAPPFRTPHHSASHVSLVGGGTNPRPGEVTLAHRGVLFLDEFPEFEKRSLEALRQPLEDGVVTVSRAKGSITFPANFILVAAMNPTPNGGGTDETLVSERDRIRYQKKISGPIMDRIDMWIEVAHIPHEELSEKPTSSVTASKEFRDRVASARALQYERFAQEGLCNSDMDVKMLDEHIILSPSGKQLLNDAAKKLSLSPRSYHRVIKLSRTIADLAGSPEIQDEHLLEALQYRPREVFG